MKALRWRNRKYLVESRSIWSGFLYAGMGIATPFFMRLLSFILLLWSCTSKPATESTLPSVPEDISVSAPKLDTTSAEVPATSTDWDIVPGKRIGKTQLGDDPEMLLQRLGTPDASDAAMGKAWLVWRGKNGGELAVFTSYADSNMVRKAVKQVYITSSRFQTAEGIHTGMSLPEIQRIFPDGHLQNTETEKRYDVEAKGISFEAEKSNRCNAVMIYTPGGSPVAYLPIPGK